MRNRRLIVIADDYGMGPETSRGILELMLEGTVTGTVLLVNSPYAEEAVRRWEAAGRPGEMGWHPNLNLDRPVAPAERVRSLLGEDGQFANLGKLMARVPLGRLSHSELVREFDAQLSRYHDLIGGPPTVVNGHKHIHVFPRIGRALREVLKSWGLRPYLRRVVEPTSCLTGVRGARLKRLFLSTLGTRAAKAQAADGLPGNDYLAGVTDPKWVEDPGFFAKWVAKVPGNVVELAVHPGHFDETILGRDCFPGDGQAERRANEQRLLRHPEFRKACRAAGFELSPAGQPTPGGRLHAVA